MAYWFFKAIFSPILFLLWRVRVEGRRNVPSEGPAILAANHQSFCDSLFIPLVLGRRVTYLAKAEYFDSWRTAWFVHAAGQVPIRRGGGDVSERALDTAMEVLDRRRLLAVYPEGTRSRDDAVHRGRTGVARLARRSGWPVVPVGVIGTEAVQPIGRRMMRPFRPVTIRFGEPRYLSSDEGGADGVGGADGADGARRVDGDGLRRFTDELMQEISRLSGRPYVDHYESSSGQGSAGPRPDLDDGSVTKAQAGGNRNRVA